MIRFLVLRPVGVIIGFFALLFLGAASFYFLPTSLLPDTDIPKLTIKVKGPNYSSKQVEANLIKPLRDNLSQLRGIKEIESRSSEGVGLIQIIFDHGTNTSMSFIEANEKIDAAMNRLPREIERPFISKASVGDIPIFNLNVFPKEKSFNTTLLSDISEFSKQIIKSRIEQLNEVAAADISGLLQSQIQITPKVGYMEPLGLNYTDLLEVFHDNDVEVGSILVKDGYYQYILKFSSASPSADVIKAMPLNLNGRLFKMGDLVDVALVNTQEKGAFVTNNNKAINFAIIKQSGVKISDMKARFYELVRHFRKDYPELNFEISQDQTNLLDFSIRNLTQDLIIGGVLAFFLMLVFVRRIKPAMLIGITMPVSLIISQLGFFLMGISLNIISLGGLILGLGLIIDNSIVVIDNINRYTKVGYSITDACISGTNEIAKPLITSVLTNCAVFVPLIFLSGLAGAIFYDQAVSITIGVISSLLVSIILLPPLYKLVYSKDKLREFEIISVFNITSWYEIVLAKVFEFPKTVLLFISILLISGIFTFKHLKKDKLPTISRSDFVLTIDWNENIDFDENLRRTLFLTSFVKNRSETNAWIGEQQYLIWQKEEMDNTKCKIYFHLNNGNFLRKEKDALTILCSTKYPNALLSFSPALNAFDEIFSNDLAPIRIKVKSSTGNSMPEINELRQYIDSLKALLPNLQLKPIPLYDKVVLKVDNQKIILLNISSAEISKKISAVLRGTFIDNLRDAEASVPIVIANQNFSSINDMLARTFVRNKDNLEIPISSLVNVSKQTEYKFITAGIEGEFYPIDIDTDVPENTIRNIKKLTKQHFKNIDIIFSGSYFENNDLLKEMAVIFLASFILLYFILAAQFESFIQPIFILAELPIALSGAFLFLYLGGDSLNLMSMIGIIVMSGLIINDSILKIDAINRLRRAGLPLKQAIHEGGHKRLKPIVMISLTSIGSLLPTLFMHDLGSELQTPLALSLIGGMFVGMFVSLFFMPLVYMHVYMRIEKNKYKKNDKGMYI